MNKEPLLPDFRIHPPSRRYLGFWVGVATLAVAAATLFCEAHLTAVPVEQTIMTAAVMILSCFIMYTSLFDAGHQKGEENEEYTRVQNAYRSARDAARPHLRSLEAFCNAWTERELADFRKRILEHAGLTSADFVRYRDHTITRHELHSLPREKRRTLRRAQRLKPIRLHASMLLNEGDGGRRSPMLSAKGIRARRTAVALIPTVIGSLITVAVTLESMDLSAATIISGVLRIFTIVWCGVRGYSAGLRAVAEDDCTVLESKAALLTAFTTGDHLRPRAAETDVAEVCPPVCVAPVAATPAGAPASSPANSRTQIP